MDNAFVFYAYWNSNQVRDLFEGLVSITNAEGFGQLAAFLVVTGLVATLLIGAVKGEGRHVIGYFAAAVLFWFIAIVPKATVVIEDVRSHTVYNVDNVPLSMAFFASATSRIGHWLTQTYETAFIPADVAKYSSFGAVYPQRVLDVLQRTGPVTIEAREMLPSVLKNCVLPEVILDAGKAAALTTSSDLWGAVKADGWVNPARLAVMPDGSVKRCPQAMADLETVLTNTELPALQRWVGLKLNGEAASVSTSIASAITQTESLLLGISRSAESSLKHSLMLTSLPQVMAENAVETGGAAAMASTLARAQGNLAGEINYRTMAKMAEDSLPKIRNALEFVVIAMFPVVALVALISGSGMGTVVRSYITLLLTIQLWPALSSVVNYLVIVHDMQPFTELTQYFGGASLQASTIIRETGASSQAIAGALLCAVPVISYALVRAGDMAVGQLVGGLMSPAQSSAMSQGASIAAGNVSQGNVSVSNVSTNNISGNKMDTSARAVDPGMAVTTSGYGTVTRSGSGEVTGLQRTGINFGVSAQRQQSFVRGHTAGNVSQTSTVTTDAARFSFTASAASNDSTTRAFAHAMRDSLSEQRAVSDNYSHNQGWNGSVTLTRGEEMGRTSSVSEGTVYQSQGEMNVTQNRLGENTESFIEGNGNLTNLVRGTGYGGSLLLGESGRSQARTASNVLANSPVEGLGAKDRMVTLGARLTGGLSMRDAQDLLDNATGKVGTQTTDNRVASYQTVRTAAEHVANNNADERVRNMARNFVRSLDTANSAGRDTTQSYVDSTSAVSTLNDTDNGSLVTTADAGVSAMNFALSTTGGNAEGLLRSVYQQDRVNALAGSLHDESVVQTGSSDAFGPGTHVSATERNADVFQVAAANVDAADTKNRDRIESVRANTLDSEVSDDVMGTAPIPPSVTRAGVDNSYSQTVLEQQDTHQKQIDRMNFDRGVVLVSKEAYGLEHEDKNFALRNAFLGAWGYRSGDEIQADLRAWAQATPQFREQLQKIGASDRDYLTSEDWERMVEIGRIPRGVRLPTFK